VFLDSPARDQHGFCWGTGDPAGVGLSGEQNEILSGVFGDRASFQIWWKHWDGKNLSSWV